MVHPGNHLWNNDVLASEKWPDIKDAKMKMQLFV
jgi:hypothetical protein